MITFVVLYVALHSVLSTDCTQEVKLNPEIASLLQNKELFLGEGAHGDVYKIFVDKEEFKSKNNVNIYQSGEGSRIPAALKLIPFSESNKTEREGMMVQEATILEKLKDIAPEFYRCGKLDESTYFIAMEFIDETLDVYLKRKKYALTISEKLKMYDDLLSMLKALYEQKIIHCDIKPGNIGHLTKSNSFKLFDFGISVENRECYSGTENYIPPEFDQEADLDFEGMAKFDVYSLGIVFLAIEEEYKKSLPSKPSLSFKLNLDNPFEIKVHDIDDYSKDTEDKTANNKPGLKEFKNAFIQVLNHVLSSMLFGDVGVRPSAPQLSKVVKKLRNLYEKNNKSNDLSPKQSEYLTYITNWPQRYSNGSTINTFIDEFNALDKNSHEFLANKDSDIPEKLTTTEAKLDEVRMRKII